MHGIYTVAFTTSGSTVALDWFELTSTASMSIGLFGLDISQTSEVGDAQDEMIGWAIKRAAGSFTSGSGGNTGVARQPMTASDSAATFTAETANTTQAAVGTGTLVTVHQSAFNVRTGLMWIPPPEMRIIARPSEAIIVSMAAASADATSWAGVAYVGEMF